MEKAKLYYISPRDVRKNRADAVSMMKACLEYSNNGFEVELVTPRIRRKEYKRKKDEIWGLYGIPPAFKVRELPTLLWDESSSLNSRIQRYLAYFFYYLYLVFFKGLNHNAVIFSKCYISVFPAIILKKMGIIRCKIIFDVAVYIDHKWSHRYIAKNVDGIVLFNEYIRKKYITEYEIPEEMIYKASFCSQYNHYHNVNNSSKNEIRKELELDVDAKIALYAGKTGPAMVEIHNYLEAAKSLPDITFVIVGRKDEYKKYFDDLLKKEGITNVIFRGFQPLNKLFKYLSSADLLLSYHDPEKHIVKYQMVPAKSTVYICSGKPVIFADLPSLREWFDDGMIFYAEPDNVMALIRKIRYIFDNMDEAKHKVKRCLEYAQRNTYESSHAGISDFIKQTVFEEEVSLHMRMGRA